MTDCRKGVLIALVVLMLAACQSDPDPAAPVASQPGLADYFGEPQADMNLLVISFDTLRADVLGVYGYPRPVSPNIDRWASKSLLFERAWSSAQATPTSFAGAWTGRWPFRVFRGWKLVDDQTLAGVFSRAGFRTAGFTNNQQLMVERGFASGFDDYRLLPSGDDDELLELALEWLENNHGERFFAWFHFLSPHTPYSYRELSRSFYQPDYQGRFERTTGGKFEVRDETELKRVRDLYDGEVYYADWIFQQLLQRLESLGILDETIVVLTSDHGEEFMDHGGLQHDTVYEEVIRVPLIIHHPGVARGVRSRLPVSNVDFYRTLPALVGIQTDKQVDGLNLLEDVPLHRAVVATAMTARRKHQFGLILEDSKYHLDCKPEFAERLYDLKVDPGEQYDIALDHPARLETLYTALELVTGGDPCGVLNQAVAGKSVDSDLSPEQLERLKSLGYIQ